MGEENRSKNFPSPLTLELQEKLLAVRRDQPFPNWPEQRRGIPNICLRSALFGVIQRGRRRAVKCERIVAMAGLEIRYTGWRLDQGDFDVLAHALHLASRQPSAPYIQFTARGFLKGIGRSQGKSGREWLKDSLRRLTATAVEIRIEARSAYGPDYFIYTGSLLDEFSYTEEEQQYFLKFNARLATLFDAGWTQLQWQKRLLLRTDLAKWLHGFYASHRLPFPIKVPTLMQLCGSNCSRLSDFRGKLRLALGELVRAGILAAWTIDAEDKVQVQKDQADGDTIAQTGGIAVATPGHSGRKGGA